MAVQELDHMKEVQEDLKSMGYTCGSAAYIPAHRSMDGYGTGISTANYLKYLRKSGLAYVPKTNSNCRFPAPSTPAPTPTP